MFATQRLSSLLREGRLEDGPPYKMPGTVWSTIARHNKLDDAKAGLKRIIEFQPTKRPEDYRIAQIAPASGKVISVIITGDQLLI